MSTWEREVETYRGTLWWKRCWDWKQKSDNGLRLRGIELVFTLTQFILGIRWSPMPEDEASEFISEGGGDLALFLGFVEINLTNVWVKYLQKS